VKKKDRKEERGKLILPSSLPSAYATLHFLLLRVRLSKDTHGTDMHPKKKLKGGRDTNGVVVGVGKSKETQRRRSGALKFSSFFFCSVFTFGGKAGEDPLQVLHMTADTS